MAKRARTMRLMLRRFDSLKLFSRHPCVARNIMTSTAINSTGQPGVGAQQSTKGSGTAGQPANWKMKGWQINEYGDLDVLQFNDNIKVPILEDPNEVLVKVQAASVNPIDVLMISTCILWTFDGQDVSIVYLSEGYGSAFFNAFKLNGIPFPITLGRDFCGVVVRKGMNVRDNIKIGDEVWGVIPPHKPGSHAEYVCVNASHVRTK